MAPRRARAPAMEGAVGAPPGVALRDATREELAAARLRSSGADGQATDAPLPARVKAMAKAETACR